MQAPCKSAAHTPGPWFADKIDDRAAFNIFPAGATFALLTVQPPEHDAAGPYGQAVKANARLIAAAPTLLEALNDVIQWEDVSQIDDEWPVVIARARAAIAAATGSEA